MSNALADYRRRNLLTLQQIADRAGLNVSTVSRYESGAIHPEESRIAELASAYGITEAGFRHLLATPATAPRADVRATRAERLRSYAWQCYATAVSYARTGLREESDAADKRAGRAMDLARRMEDRKR